jgi:hypothetical protein
MHGETYEYKRPGVDSLLAGDEFAQVTHLVDSLSQDMTAEQMCDNICLVMGAAALQDLPSPGRTGDQAVVLGPDHPPSSLQDAYQKLLLLTAATGHSPNVTQEHQAFRSLFLQVIKRSDGLTYPEAHSRLDRAAVSRRDLHDHGDITDIDYADLLAIDTMFIDIARGVANHPDKIYHLRGDLRVLFQSLDHTSYAA